ncbi:PREDICTED: early boundary activity protein 2-like, partial [Nicrophorus vespilloides]|uniref:Early boundary activity protein 2-like n=1 Tax=Nicrophorus vespilloides TaxID=110193 RepID=A0ABM1M713_NICVS
SPVKSVDSHTLVSYVDKSNIDDEIVPYKVLKTSNDELKSELGDLEKCIVKSVQDFEDLLDSVSTDFEKFSIESFHSFVKNESKTSPFEYPRVSEDSFGNKICILGVNGTRIFEDRLSTIDWSDYKKATFDLLNVVFGEEVLATHTLTRRRPKMPQLETNKVEDIISIVTAKCNTYDFDVYETISMRCNYLHMHYKKRMAELQRFNADEH